MMILHSQEVELKVKIDNTEKMVSCLSDIGMAWRNDDSIDVVKIGVRGRSCDV